MAAKLTSLSWLGLAVEATLGTPVAPTGFVPVPGSGFKPQDVYKYIPDEGLRGLPFKEFGQYQSVESSTYDVDGFAYPTSIGNFLGAIFGLDTVTGTAAPYTHTFTTADYPGSYTITDFYSEAARQWAGQKLEKLALKFTPEAGLSYTANWLGFPSAAYVPSGTQTWPTEPFFLGWEGAVSFAGVSDANLMSFTLNLARDDSKPLFAASNSQKPYDVFMGPMTADLDLEFYMVSETEYNYAVTQGFQDVKVTVTQPGTSDMFSFEGHGVQFTKPTIIRSQPYVQVRISGPLNYNATDAGLATCTLENGVSTAYTTTAST